MSLNRLSEITRAQESSAAIENLHISMLHLFNRGSYKPMGMSGEKLRKYLLTLSPEIYGSMSGNKVELNGLLYIIERLPQGIEQCRFINLTSDEGYKKSHFQVIIPKKRRRNCYRICEDQMNIEITRGRSDIYDVLTHLTFLFIESHKIRQRATAYEFDDKARDWAKVCEVVNQNKKLNTTEREMVITHLSGLLGRTFEEIQEIYPKFETDQEPDRFLYLIYWLGKLAIAEGQDRKNKRMISFSSVLRERIGHHIYGDIWATRIKQELYKYNLLERPLHIISANMHSIMNVLFAKQVLKKDFHFKTDLEYYEVLSEPKNKKLRVQVEKYALSKGMIHIKDESGTNINVQIFDTARFKAHKDESKAAVILVMDYAFGEQAYECMDELLKPYQKAVNTAPIYMNVDSISIMGKAGILEGVKGDIMIPDAHILEGTAGNYTIDNGLDVNQFKDTNLSVFQGAMVTVLGTSLQNRDLLRYFKSSTWGAIGLEMEGAHYQKAIQAASKIRKSIKSDIMVNYAYYASDNPLETGSTLASGGLGTTGVEPTYLITQEILKRIGIIN